MGRLIIAEGIPGSGKTTLAGKAADFLSIYKKTNFYKEGDGHPADLCWCACIPKEKISDVFNRFPKYELPMKQNMYEEDGYLVVPYTQFPINDSEFFRTMESFEVYDNRVGLEAFTELHRKKWIRFAEKAVLRDEYSVFECSFLQNHINELLLFHNSSETGIENYLTELIGTVKSLNPVLFYLSQPDVRETIRRVSDVRIDEKGNKVWMERVISYVENSPYGRQHGLSGFNGMVEYFKVRKQLELDIIKKLPIETHIIDNPDYDWEQVWLSAEEILKDIVKS